MAIQSLIFHRIERWNEEQNATLRLSDNAVSVTADHEALFSQMKKLFQFRAGKFHGLFDENYAEAPFQNWLKEQLDQKIGFEKLSVLFAQQFCELANKTSETFDGYLTVLLEDRADGARCYIFMLETASGLKLVSQPDSQTIDLDTLDYINTSKLDLALRIDIDDWLRGESESPYLCLVRGRNNAKIGEAFTQACGFKSSIDTAKETETLMEMLAGYTKDAEPKQAAEIRKKAFDFCVERQQMGEDVPLNELSGYLDESQPKRFAQFAEEHAQLDCQSSLRPDTRKLKHLVRLSGKGNGLSLSFSSDLMQQTILFDERTDTLTITAIPKSLKKQIVEHLKDDHV